MLQHGVPQGIRYPIWLHEVPDHLMHLAKQHGVGCVPAATPRPHAEAWGWTPGTIALNQLNNKAPRKKYKKDRKKNG